jgi:NhaP-type Na+/H+ or K+/H+ antiporter
MLAGLAVAMLVVAVLAVADMATEEIPVAISLAFWPEIVGILLGGPLGALAFWVIRRPGALAT